MATTAPSAADGRPVAGASGLRRPVDEARAVAAVTELLHALGLDPTRDGLRDTPRRVVHGLDELLTATPFAATTFPNDAGYDELVLVTDIPFVSLCEHHLLPFRGTAAVGYLPGERIVGLSKLARLVGSVASRPQVQERMTTQIADWLRDQLAPRGVGVVVAAEHLCMSIRGVRAEGCRTVTSALHGLLRERASAREEFLRLAHPRR